MRQEARTTGYRFVAFLTAALLALYISIGVWLEEDQPQRSFATSIFLGEPYVAVAADTLKILPQTEVKVLEMRFSAPLAPFEADLGAATYTRTLGEKGEWLSFRAKPGETLKGTSASYPLERRGYPGFVGEFRVVEARADGDGLNIVDLYEDHVSPAMTRQRIDIDYTRSLENLSSFAAQNVGTQALAVIKGALLVLLGSQLVLLFIGVVLRPLGLRELFASSTSERSATLVDIWANNFAVPLGFLGTVVSIWVALETSQLAYASFGQILSVIRIAIFTTVAGLATKAVCVLRSQAAHVEKSTEG